MSSLALHRRTAPGPAARRAPGGEVVELRPAGDREPLVLRPALFERLDAAGRVTLVSAPAGSGKTRLLRSYVDQAGLTEQTAWATVATAEHDGQRFCRTVAQALEDIADAPPKTVLTEAHGSRGAALCDGLLTAARAVACPAVLVVDDLHELRSPDAREALERFLAQLPATLRVVLLTRGTPTLGLHRLRLTGAVTELRGDALRFSLEETRELLAQSQVVLADDDTAALHDRAEGWAAGLRLAAIALRGHPCPERFVAQFCGSERTVAAFLRAEVLDQQPPEVRELLVRTSVLEEVSGSLADALTGRPGSLRILQELEAANAFVEAVDVGRSWFRYHGLFADLLRLELQRTEPGLSRPLHREASRWFARHGRPADAIRHAQAAGDWGDAARLLADHQLELTLDGRTAEVRGLLAGFPSEVQAFDAELALVVATGLLADGLHDEAAAQAAVAEELTDTVPADRRPGFDLALSEITLRLACARGDLDRIQAAAHQIEEALQAQPPSDVRRTQTRRAAALADLGLAELSALRLPQARRQLQQALELARRVERPSIEVSCLAYLALEETLSGRPASVARPMAEQAVALADACGSATPESAAAAFVVGGGSLVWLGRLAEAETWLERAQQTLAPGSVPALEVFLQHAWALLRLGQRRPGDAREALCSARRLLERLVGEHPLTQELHARLLHAELRLGDTGAVHAALADLEPATRGQADTRIVAAALALAEGRPEDAVDELAPVLDGTVVAGCLGWAVAIEAQLHAAAAHGALGDMRTAEAALEHALELAETEGLLLPFALVDVRDLLERHRGHRTAHATLLSQVLDLLAGASPTEETPLLDPLSDAELRVVRYLPGNMKGPEIAAELCVSPNTIRTHLRHIYAKLDVHTRSEAVARARRLGLLAPA